MSIIRFNIALILIGCAYASMSQQHIALIKNVGELDHKGLLTQMVELKLMQGSSVKDVLNLIQELLDSLLTDQAADDLAHSTQMVIYQEAIDQLQDTLDKLGVELTSLNQFIKITTEELEILGQTIKTLETQLDIINTQEQNIRDARQSDIVAFNRRVAVSNKVINALNLIITKLTKAIEDQDAAGTQAVLAQLAQELGSKHPITILVTMTAKFDKPTVERILDKLIQVRDGAVKNLEEDEAAEVVAGQLFAQSIEEIETIRKRLSEDLDTANTQFKTKSNQLTIAVARKEQVVIEIPLTQDLLDQTIASRDQYHADYVNRTERRTGEIKIVESAKNLIQDHVDQVQRQEQLSAQLNG
ncbi:hypothetical protein pb186bvf_001960 [Paramecium bursaria]